MPDSPESYNIISLIRPREDYYFQTLELCADYLKAWSIHGRSLFALLFLEFPLIVFFFYRYTVDMLVDELPGPEVCASAI